MSEIIDLHIGRRLRWRRKMLGLTQSGLGAMCGLRFQQIQKYESAANHMSAAMIWRIATALGVGPEYFYEGLGVDRSALPAFDTTDAAGPPALDPAIGRVSAS